jgi:chromosome segregation ATPase
LKSALFEDMVRQAHELMNYSLYLKQALDKADRNVLEIMKMRNFELNEVVDQTNEEKLKINQQMTLLHRDVLSYRERNIELQKVNEENKSQLLRYAAEHSNNDRSEIEHLKLQVKTLSHDLQEEKDKVRTEHHRCYKYEKEVQNLVSELLTSRKTTTSTSCSTSTRSARASPCATTASLRSFRSCSV